MKGIRQALGLTKKSSGNGHSPAKRDSRQEELIQAQLAGSPKKAKSEKKRTGKAAKKPSNEPDATLSPRSSLPGIGPLKAWDPNEPAPPATIVGADSISDDAIRFINFCAEYFLKYGPTEKGIFRISGDSGLVLRLKHQVNADPGSETWGIPVARAYVHEVSSLFKLFFREMPIPLLTYDLYTSFVSAFSISEDIRVEVTKKLLDMLPTQNRVALGILCRFLQQMAEHSDTTLMDIKNLSVVFSPNILRPRVETPETLICDARAVYGTIAEFMINNAVYFPQESSIAPKEKDVEESPATAVEEQQKPILFTASSSSSEATSADGKAHTSSEAASSSAASSAVVQQMDEQYTRLRRMSQRAITTLRKTKKLNDEELEATMLSISERIKEGDIVVASSLMNAPTPAGDTFTFSIGDSTSPDSSSSSTAVRPHRAQALSHLPPMQREGSDKDLAPPASEITTTTAATGKRSNRKRDAPFALKDDELKNLQAEIEGAREEELPAALSAPADANSPGRKSTRRGSNRHGSGEHRKHRSSTKKGKKHSESKSKSSKSSGTGSSESSSSKRSREFRRSSTRSRNHGSTAESPSFAESPVEASISSEVSKPVESTSTPAPSAAVIEVRPRAISGAPPAPTKEDKPREKIEEERVSVELVEKTNTNETKPDTVSVSESKNETSEKDHNSRPASPRSDESADEHSDAEDEEEDEEADDGLRTIQNELLSALLGEDVADEEEDDENDNEDQNEDNLEESPTQESEDEDSSEVEDN